MAQYKLGTISITNGTNVVTGVSTQFLANVAVGNSFKVYGVNALYSVIAVDSDTQIRISPNYAGATVSGAQYQISKDFTPNLGLAEIETGDSEFAFHLTHEVIRKLDAAIPDYTDALASKSPIAGPGSAQVFSVGALTATTLNGFATSQTPGASQIPVVKADSSTVLPGPVIKKTTVVGSAVTPLDEEGFVSKYGGTSYTAGIYFRNSLSSSFDQWLVFKTFIGGVLTEVGGFSKLGKFLVGTTSDSGAQIQSQVPNIGNASLSLTRAGSSKFDFIQGVVGQTGDALQLRDTTLARDYLTLRDGKVIAGTTTSNASGAALQTKDGLTFSATQVPSTDPNTLDDYRKASYTGTATGLTTSPTGTVFFARAGNLVIMTLPALSGVSNATTFTITGGPTTMRPNSQRIVMCRVADNGGATVWGMAAINTDGTIVLYSTAAGGSFTASGNKGVYSITFSYNI